MTKLTLTLLCAMLAAGGLAAAGWSRDTTTPADGLAAAANTADPAVTAPQPADVAAPPSTVTLSRAARVDGVPLRMDVALLRRVGNTATLDLRLRNNAAHGGPTFVLGTYFDDEDWWEDVSGIYLMDPATGHRLPVRTDIDDECLCTRNTDDIAIRPGGTAMLTATFPAPSRGASTADVIVPHFGAFRDVPLR